MMQISKVHENIWKNEKFNHKLLHSNNEISLPQLVCREQSELIKILTMTWALHNIQTHIHIEETHTWAYILI